MELQPLVARLARLHYSLMVGQAAVADQTHERKSIRPRRNNMELKDSVITIDVLDSQGKADTANSLHHGM